MGENFDGETPSEAATLVQEILSLAERLRRQLDAPCEARGVGGSRFAILETIHESGEYGCSQTELASRLALSGSNVSALVESLRKAGLLYRFRSKRDRRRSVLLLSDDGRGLVTLLADVRETVAASFMDKFAARKIGELRRLLGELGICLAEAEQSSPPRPTTRSERNTFRRAS